MTGESRADPLGELRELAERSRIRRVDVVAWRDLDDPEAGGSELSADRVMQRWAKAGLDVRMWTSRVDGAAEIVRRRGYTVNRRKGRYAVFPAIALNGLSGRIGTGDALLEIWNGMPFFSPLWARCPHVVLIHHVHAEMWKMVLGGRLGDLGNFVEATVAPPIYRRQSIITVSESSKQDIVERLRFDPGHIHVVPPGLDPSFSPGREKHPRPLIVAVGRLVPIKRFDWFIEAAVKLRADYPDMLAVVVGEGYERPKLEAQIRDAGAESWLSLSGRLSDEDLIKLYRRAWLVISTSSHEGWGMTITEAAACGTPAVATRITGHRDAIVDGVSGVLANTVEDIATAALRVLGDDEYRHRLEAGAVRIASHYTWDRTALERFRVLERSVVARRRDR
ncbi:MAG: glycosyltransferase family 4 protein [Acidimicrobiales bacterium]